MAPILSQVDLLYTPQTNLPKIHSDLSGLLPLGFPTKTLYTFLSSPMWARCPIHFILLDLICLDSAIILQ
jgi:hypothetical protein